MTSYFLFSLLVPLAIAQSCTEGTDKWINGRCFKFVKQQSSYQEAGDYCHNHQTYLATVADSNTATFLASYARTTFNTNDGKFWIGLSRLSTNSSFKWEDGSPFIWSNFGPIKDGLYVAENIGNTQWQTLGGNDVLNFVCSYTPGATPKTISTPTTTTVQTTVTTTTKPKPIITCLFMVDLQSAGIANQAAMTTYQTYYNFALLVASKLNDASEFSGYIDTFGYSGSLVDHSTYPVHGYTDFITIPFPIDGSDDDLIDLDLKEVDASLTTATWEPPSKDQTCLIFFSAAPEAEFGGTTIKTTYNSFSTVLGVIVGNRATSIPGLTDIVDAFSLDDGAAQAVAQRLLEILP